MATSTLVFNPFTQNFDFVGTSGGAGEITITGNDDNPQTSSAFTILGTGGLSFDWNGSEFIISGSATGFSWIDESGNTVAIVAGNGYVCSNSGLTTLTLPTVASTNFGNSFKVIGYGAGGFKIAQNSNNQIILGSSLSTPGTGGSIQTDGMSTYNSLTLVCVVAGTNAIWALDGAPQGTFTVM